jgi:hypothetical protein
MLTHHSAADYNASASAAAAEARIKLQTEIDNGKARAAAVIEQIYTQVPKDSVVPAKRLTFLPDGNQMKVAYARTIDGVTSEVVEGFHRHAIGQAANRAELTVGFIDKLMDRKQDWAAELAAHNLTQIYNHDTDRYLLRSVHGEVRGFLSSAYRRMDSRPILEQFLDGIQQYGALPLDGFALETKFALKAILPHVFEPVPNEPMVIGLALQNSDFGNGKLTLAMFVERLWCTNRAISRDEISQVHLGKRLSEDLQLSQRTLKPRGMRPRCLSCKRELRPNYRSPEMPFRLYSACGPEKKAWKIANPKTFKGTYGSYGDNRFCGLNCGYHWACAHAPYPLAFEKGRIE